MALYMALCMAYTRTRRVPFQNYLVLNTRRNRSEKSHPARHAKAMQKHFNKVFT